MANAIKGELDFEHGEASYKLRYGVNPLCELETLLKQPVTEAIGVMRGGGNLTVTRALFWAGLLENHGLTLTETGNLMTDVGIGRTADLVLDGIRLAFPKTEDAKAPKGPRTGSPSKTARGTSKSSTDAG